MVQRDVEKEDYSWWCVIWRRLKRFPLIVRLKMRNRDPASHTTRLALNGGNRREIPYTGRCLVSALVSRVYMYYKGNVKECVGMCSSRTENPLFFEEFAICQVKWFLRKLQAKDFEWATSRCKRWGVRAEKRSFLTKDVPKRQVFF